VSPTDAARLARAILLALATALCAVFVLWHALRYSPATAALASVIGVTPWLLLAPGLWRGRRESHAAALLLASPYLAYGLTEVLANPGARPFAGASVLLAFGIAVASLAYQRLTQPRAAAPT
jgi:uncharacterized membrane protein